MRVFLIRILNWLGGTVLVAAVLFVAAGRVDLPGIWVYVTITSLQSLVAVFFVDPGLLKERMRPGPGSRDRLTALIAAPPFFSIWVISGLDIGRFHWSDRVPLAVRLAGFVLYAASSSLLGWAMIVNRFFSSVVRLQADRGHQLIDSGPYAYLRHPGYTGFLIYGLSSALALGSWWALAPSLIIFPAIFRRTILEDRFLQQELEGYPDYARRVRYRLLPGLW